MGFSVHARVVRLTEAEQGIRHELVEVDPFNPYTNWDWRGAVIGSFISPIDIHAR